MAKKPRAARNTPRIVTNVIKLPQTKYKVWKDVERTPFLKLHVQSGIYYVRKFKAGKGELFRTTGEKRLGRAKTIADQMIADWIGGKQQQGRRRRVDQICDELLDRLRTEALKRDGRGIPVRSLRTLAQDELYLPKIKTLFGEEFVDAIDESYWREWVRGEGSKLKNPRTGEKRKLGDIAKYLSKVLTYSFEEKYIVRKPEIENPDKHTPKFKVYSPKDIDLFLVHANPTLRDLIIIGAECGLRPHENCGLRWDFIQISKKQVRLTIPAWFEKRRKGREIILGRSATEVILRRSKRRNGPYVFPSPSDIHKPLNRVRLSRYWRTMLEDAGLDPDTTGKFHWLRHSFFSKALLERGLELPKVAAYGGNSPKILFDRYLDKSADRTRDVSEAMSLKLGEEE